MLIVLLVLAALTLAFANGANDNFKATATLYGSGSLSYESSRRLATLAQLAGSLASVVWAEALLRAFSGKGLVPEAVISDPAFLVAVGGGAAATILIATRVGLPISTTHALVGGLVGAGVGLAPGHVSWAALGGSYFLPLLVSPVLALAFASVAYPLVHSARRLLGIEADTCLCIGEARDLVCQGDNGAWIVQRTGMVLSVDQMGQCQDFYAGNALGFSVQSIVDRLHEGSAFALGFARGLNDTPKVLALLVAVGWAGAEPKVSLAIIATSMALGGYFRAHRVAKTLAHGITSLTHGQGLLANSIASALVIFASLLGSPVSTTHVSTGALFGIGLWNDRTNWPLVGGIVGAWVGTLPLAAALAALLAVALR